MFSSTCLLVSRITPKLLNRFSKTSVERWHIGHGRNSEILVVIRIWMQEFFLPRWATTIFRTGGLCLTNSTDSGVTAANCPFLVANHTIYIQYMSG